MSEKSPKGVSEQKIYVLDTNVLLHDPNSIFHFEDNEVVIPIVVIEELDEKKKEMTEIGRNARKSVRIIDDFRAQGQRINKCVSLPSGGTFRVEVNNDRILDPKSPLANLDLTKADNRILLVAYNLYDKEKSKDEDNPRRVVIVSNDGALRIKAEAVNLRAEEYKTDVIDFNTLYTGFSSDEVIIPDDVMEPLYTEYRIDWPLNGILPNQFVEIRSKSGAYSATARYHSGKLYAINKFKMWSLDGIAARNHEQNCFADLLMNDSVGMMTGVGKAGTGKTILAIAAGLERVNAGAYSRLVITRPTHPVGKDIGFLPGGVDEKMEPWMRPIFDSLEFLFSNKDECSSARTTMAQVLNPYKALIADGLLEIAPLGFQRGTTIPRQFFIVDELQNLTPHETKTIATRVGQGTKIVLTGDPYQIDNPYVTINTNGLTHFVDRMKGQHNYGHVTLIKGERSEIATQCAELL